MKKVFVKIVLFVIFCFASHAYAGDISFMPNNAGGKIVFTDDVCKKRAGWLINYGTTASGDVIFGCWTMFNNSNNVWVIWDNGTTKVYDTSNIELTEYGSKGINKSL